VSHAGFLRQHWTGGEGTWLHFVRSLWTLGEEARALPPLDGLEHVLDWLPALGEHAQLDAQDLAQLAYVARLTLAPNSCRTEHLEPLRAVGFDEQGILDIVNVAACFAYMNRLVDGLGVTLHPDHEALAIELFGPEALAAHREWGA
jgi:hypothetical protein